MIITVTTESEDGTFVTCTGYEIDHLNIPGDWRCTSQVIIPYTPDLAGNAIDALRVLGGMGSIEGADIHDV